MTRWPRAVLVALAVATAVALAVGASTSGSAFGVYNPRWDGASDLRGVAADAGAEARVTLDADGYRTAGPEGTVAVVLSPDRAYGPAAAAGVREFVRSGGTLVVAEDFGPHGNELLAAVGASARVDGALLRDERSAYRTPVMPVATGVADHPLTAGVKQLTLNHGTAVRPNGATVLASTSTVAYRDADRDGVPDPGEEPGPHPVATVERVGEGRVVVLGDPSLLINAMLDRPGNRRLAANLFSGSDRALLDYARAERLPPLAVAVVSLRRSPLAGAAVGTAGVLALVAWGRRFGRAAEGPSATDDAAGATGGADAVVRGDGAEPDDTGGPPTAPDREALVAYLRERHPDWPGDRVERVVDAVVADRDRPGRGS